MSVSDCAFVNACGCSLMDSSTALLQWMFLLVPVNWKPKKMMSKTMG